ncbi:hypothetical protein [Flexithrix dorotheae]|uniref:hypothetical protein n=1 Tax=Flexithrix dorotheae TaxID=70993 RepID=UPI00035EAB16|nr:hypothetical protein [Flexithrix dorotheae]
MSDESLKHIRKLLNGLGFSLILFLVALFLIPGGVMIYSHVDFSSPEMADPVSPQLAENTPKVLEAAQDAIVDGKDAATGLIADENYQLVKTNCTACHSAKLITQNRATRAGWESMIRWMQNTQKLWDLGPNEPLILDYLAKNYAPQKQGRRKNLENIEWYELKD